MEEEMLELMWSNHSSIFRNLFTEHREKERYTDVTIGCEGKLYSVHKLVLATCSKYFQEVFAHTEGKHPVLLLHDVKQHELEALLCYMYGGSATVSQCNLARFVKVAEALQIKGLAVADEESFDSITGEEYSASDSGSRSPMMTEDDGEQTEPPYKRRYEGSAETTIYSSTGKLESQGNCTAINEEKVAETAHIKMEEGATSPNHYSFQGFNCQHIKNSADVDIKKRRILEKIKQEEEWEETQSTTGYFQDHNYEDVAGNFPQKKLTNKNKSLASSELLEGNERESLNGQNKMSIRRMKATNPASMKLYKCGKCSYRSDYKAIKKHFLTHSISKSVKCPHCFSSFASKLTLRRHMKKHTHAQEFVCIYCHARFGSKEFLTNHLETHDKSKPYSCTFCRASFSRKDKLNVHLKKHEAEGKVRMPSKSKSSSQAKGFSEVFACNECSSTFENHGQYVEHTKMHASERQFSCSVCPAAFAKKVHLSRHVLSHKGFGSRDKLQDIN